jgi:hypothetical protein
MMPHLFMEAPEVPTEHLHEELEHHAHGGPRWIMGVALSSALLAGLAAVASFQTSDHESEAMLTQLAAADHWSHFQSKSIKESQLKSKMDILEALGKPAAEGDKKQLEKYAEEKKEIQNLAEEKQKESTFELKAHKLFAPSVTMFQIAIAMGAIAALTKRKPFWFVSLGIGVVGMFYIVQAFRHTSAG